MKVIRLRPLLFALTVLVGACEAAGTFARDICDYGAVGDGMTLNTNAINRAVEEVAAAGGGTVVVPAGRYRTGTIWLKSNVVLNLSPGSVLIGSTDLRDYPEQPAPAPDDTVEFRRILHMYPQRLEYGRYSLISAVGQENVGVTGEGIIDGSGDHPNFSKAEMRKAGLSREEAHFRRPYGLSFVRCTNVTVKGVTLRNQAFWCQSYLDCDGVLVDGVRVDSLVHDRNNDGIDIDGCRKVRVQNCWLDAGDDAICLKSSFRTCEDVVITNNVCSSLANGVKMGTASVGGFRNIAISNLVLRRVAAAGIALEVVDGGTLDGVVISNVVMREVGAAIFIRLGDRGRQWMRPDDRTVGALRNVSIENIIAHIFTPYDGRPLASSISGLVERPVENIRLSGVKLVLQREHSREVAREIARTPVLEAETDYPEYSMFGPLPASGFYVRHVRGMVFADVEVSLVASDYRSVLVCDDVEDLRVSGWRGHVPAESEPYFYFRDVRGADLPAAIAPKCATFLHVEGASEDITLPGADLSRAAVPVSLVAPLPAESVRH